MRCNWRSHKMEQCWITCSTLTFCNYYSVHICMHVTFSLRVHFPYIDCSYAIPYCNILTTQLHHFLIILKWSINLVENNGNWILEELMSVNNLPVMLKVTSFDVWVQVKMPWQTSKDATIPRRSIHIIFNLIWHGVDAHQAIFLIR